MKAIQDTAIGQHLTFKLDQESYAVSVGNVQEILEYLPITRLPQTPEFMRGIMNVRGNVVPVIDLRLKFGMSRTKDTINTCIIVMELITNEEKTVIGVLADSAEEVIEFGEEDIEPAPKMGTGVDTELIQGIGKRGNDFTMLLDVNKIFSSEEMMQFHEAGMQTHS